MKKGINESSEEESIKYTRTKTPKKNQKIFLDDSSILL